MTDKWEVRLQRADSRGDQYYGIFRGDDILVMVMASKTIGELICACVNAIEACARPLDMTPLEFAKRLEAHPEIGWFAKYTDERQRMKDLLFYGEYITVDGKRVDPAKVEIQRTIVPKEYMRGKPTLAKEGDVECKEEQPLQGEEGQDRTRQDLEEGQG